MEEKEDEKYRVVNINFFKKVWYSITKFEKYPELAALGVKKALIYFTELIVIFCVIYTGSYVYYVQKVETFEEENLSCSSGQEPDKSGYGSDCSRRTVGRR